MNQREIRMRCIEALSSMGVREVKRIIAEAKDLEDWVMAAKPDKPAKAPASGQKQLADKVQAPA